MFSRSLSYHFGTFFVFVALLFARSAAAEVHCDTVTPQAVEKLCGVPVHVIPGNDVGEKDCSRTFGANDGTKKGVTLHLLKGQLTQDPKWTNVKSIPGFDAAFSYHAATEPLAEFSGVAASRGGVVAYVDELGEPSLCSVDAATQIASAALPPAEDRPATAFEAGGSDPERRDGAKLLVTAYVIIWLLISFYVGMLWRSQRAFSARIEGLERAIDRAEARAEGAPFRGVAPEAAKAKAKAKKKKDDETEEEEDEG